MTAENPTYVNFDCCPTDGRRITDTDPDGCEAANGQRYHLGHLSPNADPELYDRWTAGYRPALRLFTTLCGATWNRWPALGYEFLDHPLCGECADAAGLPSDTPPNRSAIALASWAFTEGTAEGVHLVRGS